METTETETAMEVDKKDDMEDQSVITDDENKENIITYVIGEELPDFKEIISIEPVVEEKTSNPTVITTEETPPGGLTTAETKTETTIQAENDNDMEVATLTVEPITVKSEIDTAENELVLVENVETKTSITITDTPTPMPLSPKKISKNRQIRQRSSPRNTRGLAKIAKLDRSQQTKLPDIKEISEQTTNSQKTEVTVGINHSFQGRFFPFFSFFLISDITI